jgi:hypothetical protein
MLCPSCGHENAEDSKFRRECGISLRLEVTCPNCGRGNPPGTKFCHGCGQRPAEARAPTPTLTPIPTSFVVGRNRVYLAHDTRLDRDVAFSLIKTEGFDAVDMARVRREAQAMGHLGDHLNIVTIYDIGGDNVCESWRGG